MTTMIRVAELQDAVDRARGAINDPRVFNPVAMNTMFDFEMACADASYSDVIDDPDVATACATLTAAVTGVLFARAASYRAGFFKKLAANRAINRAGLAAQKALHDLKHALRTSRQLRL
jgi:hypothetical protein